MTSAGLSTAVMASKTFCTVLVLVLTLVVVSCQRDHYMVKALRQLHGLKTTDCTNFNQGACSDTGTTQLDSSNDRLTNVALMLGAQTLKDIQSHASELLDVGFPNLPNSSYEVSEICMNHTGIFLEGLRDSQVWAIEMVDSVGKLPSGMLGMGGGFTWLGAYEECVAVQAVVQDNDTETNPFTGRYCTATVYVSSPVQNPMIPTVAQLTIGVCVPNSCSSEDTSGLINRGIYGLPVAANKYILTGAYAHCQEETLELDSKAEVAIALCSVFLVLLVAGTVYDVLAVQLPMSDKVKVTKPRSGSYGTLPAPAVKTEIIEKPEEHHYVSFAANLANEEQAQIKESESLLWKDNGTPCRNKKSKGSAKGKHTQLDANVWKDPHQRGPGTLGKVLLSFSVYTNGAKILNTSQPAGTLSAVNGIRFLSMTWVILGHTFIFGLSYGDNTSFYGAKIVKRWTFQAITNATVSVDSFFVLSGLLVAYLTLREIKKVGGIRHFNWLMYYFHRFWRLTPPYMLFMMFYVCLMRYWDTGPLWNQQGMDTDNCGDYWWRNLLYINNLYKGDKMCMGWTWYLANDMQFYVLSPLMLIPLYYSSVFGGLVCLCFLLACLITSGVISASHNFPANALLDKDGKMFEKMYIKPYTRIGPYIIGIVAGYILYRTECKLRIPKLLNLAYWAAATATALAVLYGLYNSDNNLENHLTTGVSAFYNATSRTAWGVVVAWVIVACASGNGGFVNTILSWKAFVPLGRLTYCAYLVHPIAIFLYYQSRDTLIHFYDLQMIYIFLGHLCIAYAAAFCTSLAFESPMMGLEKALLGRGKRS